MKLTDKELKDLVGQLSAEEALKFLQHTEKKHKKTRIQFPQIKAESNVVGARLCISLKDAKMFLSETLLIDLNLRPTATIKAQFVEGFSTMAELMDDPMLKENFLKTAARAVMMDRDSLVKYIAAIVTNI